MLWFLAAMLGAGCVVNRGTFAPLGPEHPANAEAPEAPAPQPTALVASTTVAPEAPATPRTSVPEPARSGGRRP